MRRLSAALDDWSPPSFRLSDEDVERLVAEVPTEAIEDISWSQAQVRRFAVAQFASLGPVEVETLDGVVLGHRYISIQSVGCYVPGGRYPMVSSAFMSVVSAKVAGVPRIIACTPAIRGGPCAATAVASMHLAGADEIYVLGGVQAITSMALGTETILNVDMLGRPGNAHVAEAKRQLFGEVEIDLVAGPTAGTPIGEPSPLRVVVDVAVPTVP
jgi:sulfopropanediol 3-dehydrogenase